MKTKTSERPGVRANEERQQRKLRVLRRAIRQGLREVESGKTISGADAFAAVDELLRHSKRKKKSG